MRACVQRVSRAQVTVSSGESGSPKVCGKIENGLLVLLGVAPDDTEKDAKYLADKICGLRVFEDDDDKMNLSVADTKGAMLVVSQFTLFGDCRKGRRPSFVAAAEPKLAERLYESFITVVGSHGIPTQCGQFRQHMEVELVNDGPVTLLLDSKKLF